jgi:hypothetical protein
MLKYVCVLSLTVLVQGTDYCTVLCELDPSCPSGGSYCKHWLHVPVCQHYHFKTPCKTKGCWEYKEEGLRHATPVTCDDAFRIVENIRLGNFESEMKARFLRNGQVPTEYHKSLVLGSEQKLTSTGEPSSDEEFTVGTGDTKTLTEGTTSLTTELETVSSTDPGSSSSTAELEKTCAEGTTISEKKTEASTVSESSTEELTTLTTVESHTSSSSTTMDSQTLTTSEKATTCMEEQQTQTTTEETTTSTKELKAQIPTEESVTRESETTTPSELESSATTESTTYGSEWETSTSTSAEESTSTEGVILYSTRSNSEATNLSLRSVSVHNGVRFRQLPRRGVAGPRKQPLEHELGGEETLLEPVDVLKGRKSSSPKTTSTVSPAGSVCRRKTGTDIEYPSREYLIRMLDERLHSRNWALKLFDNLFGVCLGTK